MQLGLGFCWDNGKNIDYDSEMISTVVDRSYLTDKITLALAHRPHQNPMIQKYGVSISAEQRLYGLESELDNFDDWKFSKMFPTSNFF